VFLLLHYFFNCFSCVTTEGAEDGEVWVIRRDRVTIGCDHFSDWPLMSLSALQDKMELNTSTSNKNFRFSRLLILRITVFLDLTPCVFVDTHGSSG
jgi:hypothetical protein